MEKNIAYFFLDIIRKNCRQLFRSSKNIIFIMDDPKPRNVFESVNKARNNIFRKKKNLSKCIQSSLSVNNLHHCNV